MENRISASLPADQLKTVLDLIRQLEAALPFLMALSPDERKSLPRMGDASRPFVDKSLKIAQAHGNFLPRSFDTGEFAADVQLYNALGSTIGLSLHGWGIRARRRVCMRRKPAAMRWQKSAIGFSSRSNPRCPQAGCMCWMKPV